MGKKKKCKILKNDIIAVSEVLGTVLLLLISVSLFSVVYVSLFSVDVEPITPSVTLVGTIKDNNLILEHRGGESLSLDTGLILRLIDSTTLRVTVNDVDSNGNPYLADSCKADNNWDIGEKVVFPLDGLSGFNRFDPIDVSTVDEQSNSMVMMGKVQECRFADIEVSLSYTPPNPTDQVDIIVKVENKGPSIAEEIFVQDVVKDGLKCTSSSTTDYDLITGLWNVGNLDEGTFAELTLTNKIIPLPSKTFTQMAIIIDGSSKDGYHIAQWEYIKQGLYDAVLNTIPHNGKVELTVIQYGGASARLEVGPVVLSDSNYNSVLTAILGMNKMSGNSLMSAGINLARSTLFNSPNFDSGNIHIINLMVNTIPDSKQDAEDARTALINDLGMTEDQDEIDVEITKCAYNVANHPFNDPVEINWITKKIAWPAAGYYNYDDTFSPVGSWVRVVLNGEKLVASIKYIFSGHYEIERVNTATLISTKYFDPDSSNNEDQITIIVGGG